MNYDGRMIRHGYALKPWSPTRLAPVLLAMVLGGTGCVEAEHSDATPADRPDPVMTKHVFRQTPERELSLHLFEVTQDASSDDKTARPVVVFFNGGGWVSGDVRQFYPQARELAGRGVVAICAEYRVRNTDGTTHREALDDALHAVAWVRAHAEDLNLHPDRIAVGGGSAGGQLAAACATVPDEHRPDELPASARPNLLLLFNPALDNGPGPDACGYPLIGEDYPWFSPAHNVRAGLPPTLIMLGTEDPLIPVAVAERFRDAMQDHGNHCEVELYPGQNHGFFNRSRGADGRYTQTLARSMRFLGDHGWLTDDQD